MCSNPMDKVFYSKYKYLLPAFFITIAVSVLIGVAIAQQIEYNFVTILRIVLICAALNILFYTAQIKKVIFYRRGLISFCENNDSIHIYDYSHRSKIETFLTGAKVVIQKNIILYDRKPEFFHEDSLDSDYHDINGAICSESLSICINDYFVSTEDMSSCEAAELLKYIKETKKHYNFDLSDYETYKDFSSRCTIE